MHYIVAGTCLVECVSEIKLKLIGMFNEVGGTLVRGRMKMAFWVALFFLLDAKK